MSDNLNTLDSSIDVQLLFDNFDEIVAQADAFTTSFYDYLFIHYPHIKPLFDNTDMEMQKEKLIKTLELAIVNISKPEILDIALKELGQKHIEYGAVLTDYPLIGTALLQTLKQYLGEEWTTAAETNWTLTYQKLAEIMIQGVKELEE